MRWGKQTRRQRQQQQLQQWQQQQHNFHKKQRAAVNHRLVPAYHRPDGSVGQKSTILYSLRDAISASHRLVPTVLPLTPGQLVNHVRDNYPSLLPLKRPYSARTPSYPALSAVTCDV